MVRSRWEIDAYFRSSVSCFSIDAVGWGLDFGGGGLGGGKGVNVKVQMGGGERGGKEGGWKWK